MITSDNILLISSILLISGVLFGKMSYRLGVPLLFVSWVGLRGAVPIIFATYPVVAQIEGSSQIFNIVFFVTLLSLLVQGTTVIYFSQKLKLTEEPTIDEKDFGVELSETDNTQLETLIITPKHIANGDTLKDMHLPKGQLVMMVQRNGQHIIPNGTLHLKPGDALLIIKEADAE